MGVSGAGHVVSEEAPITYHAMPFFCAKRKSSAGES